MHFTKVLVTLASLAATTALALPSTTPEKDIVFDDDLLSSEESYIIPVEVAVSDISRRQNGGKGKGKGKGNGKGNGQGNQQHNNEKRDVLEVWDNKNFLGLKLTLDATLGKCENFPNDFNNKISSARAKKSLICTIWPEQNCKGDLGFSFDDGNGAKVFPKEINNKASSFRCVKA